MPNTNSPVRRVARNRMISAEQRGFYADVVAAGQSASVTTVIEPRPVPAHIAAELGVPAGTPLLARARHMAADGVPLQLATSYFPVDVVDALPILAEQNTGAGGMYARFEEAGHTLHQVDIVGARATTDEETAALQLDEPFALTIVRVTRDAGTGQVLEVGDLLVVPGRQELLYQV